MEVDVVEEVLEEKTEEVDELIEESIVEQKEVVEDTQVKKTEELEIKQEEVEKVIVKEVETAPVNVIEEKQIETPENNIQETITTKVEEVIQVDQDIEYRIVIHESKEPLPEQGGLYDKHSDLLEYFDIDGKYKYLIGSFIRERQATKFLKGAVRLAYPEAYMVKFAGGQILP